MHHLFIINRYAGKKDNYDFICNQIKEMELKNYTIIDTVCKRDATKKAREFVTNSTDFVYVYACGGDGTVNEVINGIYDLENCALAVVPIGTGNDFVRSLGRPSEDFLNIRKLAKGTLKDIDLISCNGLIGANSVSLGYDCAVAKNAPKFKRWKFISSEFAYKISIFYCIITSRKHNFRIIADNMEIKRKSPTYLLSISAKGKYYGGGIMCAPQAENNDGYLDFLCVDTVGIFKIIQLLSTFIKGKHLDDPRLSGILVHSKHKTVEYISDEPFDVGIDGETINTNHAVLKILPKALKVVLPAE